MIPSLATPMLSRMAPVLVFGAGAALALAIFPIGLLFGLPSYWEHVQGDNSANWIGYLGFARDGWRWPIFQTKLLAPPDGVNILFTDPIPMLALLGKGIFKISGYLPNYFGFWLLMAYALQTLCAYALLRSLELTRIAAMLASALFLLFPAFIFRYGHFALLAHWLLLVALLLYFLIAQRGEAGHIVLGGTTTLALVLVNPYLLIMVAAIYLAALCDAARRHKVSPGRVGAAAMVLIAAVFATAVLFGFIDPTEPTSDGGGFGHYSMNLLSPIVPQLSAWPGHDNFVLDATRGQIEGYNYLGGGILVLIALAVVFAFKPMKAFVRGHAFLFLAAGALAIYAVSTRVYAGSWLVVDLSLLDRGPLAKFSGIFRCSGRFFWPLGYLLLTTAIYALFVRFGERRFLVIVLAATFLQAVDVRPLIASVIARSGPGQDTIDRQQWRAAVAAHDELLILPQFLCMTYENRQYGFQLGLIAAELGLPTNSVYVNRSKINCNSEKVAFTQNLRAEATRRNPIVVALKNEVNANVVHSDRRRAGLSCRDAGFAYVCSANLSAVVSLGSELAPPPVSALNERLFTNEGGRGLTFLLDGWSPPSVWGVWGIGQESAISATLADPVCSDLLLRATVMPFAAASHFVSSADVWVNGRMLTTYRLAAAGEQELALRIANPGCVRLLEIEFRFTDLKSPQQLGVSADARPLSWALRSFSLERAQ